MNKMRNNRTSIALVAIPALLIATVFSSCSSSDGESKEKKENKEVKAATAPAPAETFALQKGTLSTTLYVPGELIAFQQVDLYAKENAFVKKLYVDVGSEVHEGQLLVTME